MKYMEQSTLKRPQYYRTDEKLNTGLNATK